MVCPFIFKVLLPNYNPGMLSAQILILGCFFVCLMQNGANFLIATNRHRTLIKHVLLSLLINVAGNIGLVKEGYGIEGIAVSTGISELIACTLIWRSIFASLGYRACAQWKEIAFLYLPFCIPVGGIATFRYIFASFGTDITFFSLVHIGLLLALNVCLILGSSLYREWIKDLYCLVKRKTAQAA